MWCVERTLTVRRQWTRRANTGAAHVVLVRCKFELQGAVLDHAIDGQRRAPSSPGMPKCWCSARSTHPVVTCRRLASPGRHEAPPVNTTLRNSVTC
jgi:hypothetical protein